MNNVIPCCDSIIPLNNVDKHCKSLNNTAILDSNSNIPHHNSVIPKYNDAIPIRNDCDKSVTTPREVIPIVSNDIKDRPNDELSYTTGINMPSKYNNQCSIEDALLCTPAVFYATCYGR